MLDETKLFLLPLRKDKEQLISNREPESCDVMMIHYVSSTHAAGILCRSVAHLFKSGCFQQLWSLSARFLQYCEATLKLNGSHELHNPGYTKYNTDSVRMGNIGSKVQWKSSRIDKIFAYCSIVEQKQTGLYLLLKVVFFSGATGALCTAFFMLKLHSYLKINT